MKRKKKLRRSQERESWERAAQWIYHDRERLIRTDTEVCKEVRQRDINYLEEKLKKKEVVIEEVVKDNINISPIDYAHFKINWIH